MTAPRTIRPAGESGSMRLPLDRLLADTLEGGASHVHIEPETTGACVRVRCNLELKRFLTLSREEYFAVWQNIVDRFGSDRLDPFFEGSFPFNHEGESTVIRVSIVPTPHGDSIALKINSLRTKVLPLDRLGLARSDLARLEALMSRAHGLVVFAGPSGAGCTTTLLSALSFLHDGTRKVVSIEDPIEVHLEGIQQIQVKVVRDCPERSVTFARALHAASMQNADVIGIGQLRDRETADTALQASLSGVQVLSRVHAPTAALAVSRLHYLGASPQTLADSLRAVLAQALLRRNCASCSEPEAAERLAAALPPAVAAELEGRARRGRGCKQCHGAGASGVVPVFELLDTGAEVSHLVAERRTASEIERHAVQEGMVPLATAVRNLVLAGEVAVAEYVRRL
jgi:type II secretory ATPase GspE/PulE/Tfp pilus assembly ATPase PilB-like protein